AELLADGVHEVLLLLALRERLRLVELLPDRGEARERGLLRLAVHLIGRGVREVAGDAVETAADAVVGALVRVRAAAWVGAAVVGARIAVVAFGGAGRLAFTGDALLGAVARLAVVASGSADAVERFAAGLRIADGARVVVGDARRADARATARLTR